MNIKISLLLMHFLCILYINAEPILKFSQGTLNGTVQKSRNSRNYSAFLGIPYAKPPTGNLRFSNPLPADNWDGTRQANSFGNKCPQKVDEKIIGNEDCLFLNVYTPILEFDSLTKDNLLPVMVYVHGGGFIEESGDKYKAEYLLDKEIVLVTMNYRLGIFGFFSTADSVAPGNFGMKDQVLALKWVQKNIEAFGGNPNKVTLFGESAGGASVSLHALSKASTGLFHQYIIMSSAPLSPWAHQKKSNFVLWVRGIGALVLCPFINSQKLVDCLRTKSIKSLIETSSIFGNVARTAQLTWTPTDEIDDVDAFLIDSPKNLIEKNQMKDLPFMIGSVTDEGLSNTGALYSSDTLYQLTKLSINLLISFIGNYYLETDHNVQFTLATDKFYFNNTILISNKNAFLGSLTKFITDGFFLYPQVRTLEKVTSKMKNPNYFYSFGYRGLSHYYSKYNPEQNLGVGHSDELLYLFPLTSRSNFTSTDTKISNLLIDLWTSFAINGKPTSDKLSESNMWSAYTSQNNTHLQIGNIKNNTDPTVTLSNTFYPDRMNFWKENCPL